MNMEFYSLAGKIAIVTGGSRGTGKTIALALAKFGADVAICSRSHEDGRLDATAQEIKQLGRRSLAVKADIRQKTDVENFVLRTIDEFGRIDILVNNAGVMPWDKPLLECNETDWDDIIDTNLKGYFLCSQAVGQKMAEQKRGNIISLSSVVGAINVFPGSGTYCIAKAGVVTLTRVLSLELAKYNIRVNAIAPGWVKTDMNIKVRSVPGVEEQIASGIPLKRMGETNDIAKVCVFLASDASSYITGQTIVVDGGLTENALVR